MLTWFNINFSKIFRRKALLKNTFLKQFALYLKTALYSKNYFTIFQKSYFSISILSLKAKKRRKYYKKEWNGIYIDGLL
jgi:hypothetical protein